MPISTLYNHLANEINNVDQNNVLNSLPALEMFLSFGWLFLSLVLPKNLMIFFHVSFFNGTEINDQVICLRERINGNPVKHVRGKA
jgi:hypothetical protein